MKHCGVDMVEWRSRQYLETRYECKSCRYQVAVHDDGELEILVSV